MSPPLKPSQLEQLSQVIAHHMGLRFNKERWPDLERGIRLASSQLGFQNIHQCLDWLFSSSLAKNQIEILASYLTVGETYFFRDQKYFEILETKILPPLIERRRGTGRYLRIWSAGCCTGEEPYSIAMMLSQMLPDFKKWQISILATDINPLFLQKAKTGVYSSWSFREMPAPFGEKYFTKIKADRFKIDDDIREAVSFQYLNLAEDVYPSLLNNTNAMDLIFCRNVLMYFSPELMQKIIQHFYRCLVREGSLIVSSVETSQIFYRQFSCALVQGLTFYQKNPHDILQDETPKSNPVEEAQSFYEQGLYEEAAQSLSPCLSEDPPSSKTMFLLSRSLANQGKLSEALERCQEALSLDKMNPAGHYLLATIFQEQGQLAKAAAAFRQALYLEPHFVLAHFALGHLTARQGKFEESSKYFENVLDILKSRAENEILPESDGLTAGRLREITRASLQTGAAA